MQHEIGQTRQETPSRDSRIYTPVLKYILGAQMAMMGAALTIEKPVPSAPSSRTIHTDDVLRELGGEYKAMGVFVDNPAKHRIAPVTHSTPCEPNTKEESQYNITIAEDSPHNIEKEMSLHTLAPHTQNNVDKSMHQAIRENCANVQKNIRGIAIFIMHYRLNAEEMERVSPADIDCNDHANRACEKLSKLGLPMYVISICPKHSLRDIAYSWHQFAACKVREKDLLIIDNNRVLIWEGTLEEYVETRSSSALPMKIVPFVGVTPYREPLLHGPSAQALQHFKHAGYTPADMEPYIRSHESEMAVTSQK